MTGVAEPLSISAPPEVNILINNTRVFPYLDPLCTAQNRLLDVPTVGDTVVHLRQKRLGSMYYERFLRYNTTIDTSCDNLGRANTRFEIVVFPRSFRKILYNSALGVERLVSQVSVFHLPAEWMSSSIRPFLFQQCSTLF